MRPVQFPGQAPGLAIIAIAVAVLLLLAGCTMISGNEANQIAPAPNASAPNSTVQANSTTADPPAQNSSANASNTCTTSFIKQCPDNTTSYEVACNSGYTKSIPCVSNPYGRNLTGIPSSLLYLSDFKCYWSLRDAYPYGPILDPFVLCKSDTIGWEESCECAAQIQDYVSQWGFPE